MHAMPAGAELTIDYATIDGNPAARIAATS